MPKDIPSSILIVGSGVFGLSTAYSLAQRPELSNVNITVLDRVAFPAQDAASIDSSRIVRPDYPDAAYTQLAAEAQRLWRGEFGANGRYTESGLAIILDEADFEEGQKFVRESLNNVKEKLGLKVGPRSEGGQVTVLEDEKAIKEVVKNMSGDIGKYGYINWTSGWAHAENAMTYLRKLVESTGRVEFKKAEIASLLFEADNKVKGVRLANGDKMTADLTVLATGAWTPQFIDLRGVASATGQILTYIDLTQEEQDRLGDNPSILHKGSCMFIIPPRNRVLKVARHGYGYANLVTIPNPEPSAADRTIEVSLPRTKMDDPNLSIPPEGMKVCRDFLALCIPELADRPFTHTRICWYTDTPNSDFVIDYHPKYKGLFVATGGSGHAYKFLPVIGDRIMDVLLEQDRDELGKELRRKWRWPEKKFRNEHVFTDDWRGGRKGMILDEEVKKGIGQAKM
jgi:sarcosine oxidase/L-pipecolate oxidase